MENKAPKDGIRDWNKKLDAMSAAILKAEETLSGNGYSEEVWIGSLGWAKNAMNRFRIMYETRPLIETKVSDRIRGFKLIPKLIAECNSRMENLLKGLEI